MYSLVLAAALTAGTSAPDLGFGFSFGFGCYCGPAPVCYGPCGPCWDCCSPCWYNTWCPAPCPLYYPVYYQVYYPPCYPVCWTYDPCYWIECPPAMKRAGSSAGKKKAKESEEGKDDPSEANEEEATAKATVVVRAPLDVELKFNGVKVKRTAVEETFATPVLKAGRPFHYKVAARATRDGQKVWRDVTVVVRAGKLTEVDLRRLEPESAE